MSAEDEHPDVIMARADFMACAYNAAVNYGSERGVRKMGNMIAALNRYERAEGKAKLDRLRERGIIDNYTPCPDGCEVRPGGLFHVDGCENDMNHAVYRERQQRAREVLPGGQDGTAGWRASSVTLVGSR